MRKSVNILVILAIIAVVAYLVHATITRSANFIQLGQVRTEKPGTPNIAWRAPSFSPGSAPGIFACSSLDAPGIFLRYPDGTEWDAYPGKLGEHYLAWSPDGRYLAMRIEQIPEQTPRALALVVLDAKARTVERVTDYLPGLGRPAWRLLGNGRVEVYAPIPHGLIIRKYETALTGTGPAFRLYEQGGEIILAPDSGPSRQISQGGGYAPALAPDGKHFLYQWGDGIFLAGVDDPPGQARTPVAGGVSPCWSPDGGQIAFIVATDTGDDASQSTDIWLLYLSDDGQPGKPVPLTSTPQEIKLELAWPEPNRLFFAVRNDGSIRCAELNREE